MRWIPLERLDRAQKKLDPCPFCGASKFTRINPQEESYGRFYSVSCGNCPATMRPIFTTSVRQIIATWNNRPRK
jgi:Lar family restriction alleviation protein